MALRGVDGVAGRQGGAGTQGRLQPLGRPAAAQPFTEQGTQGGILAAQTLQQRNAGGQRWVQIRVRALALRGRWPLEKRQLGRRDVGGEGAHHFQARHLQRPHAFAQRRFEGVFPAWLDLQPRPQGGQTLQAVPQQPGLELAVGLDPFLQRFEGIETGRQLGQRARLGIGPVLGLAARGLGDRQRVLQSLAVPIGGGLGLPCGVQVVPQRRQAVGVRQGQGLAVGPQAFVALLQSPGLLFQPALLGRQHLNGLLHLHHRRPLLRGPALGLAHCILQRRQLQLLLLAAGRQHLGLLGGQFALLGQLFQLLLGQPAPLQPLHGLFLQLLQAQLHPAAPLDDVADLGLQARHLGAGLVQPPLGLVDLVAGVVMGLAHGFQVGLDPAQIGRARLQFVHPLPPLGLHARQLGLGVLELEEPQLLLPQRHLRLEPVVALRHLGLLLQLVPLGVELAEDVVHPGQVFAGVFQAVRGLTPALFVLGNARGLLQEQAQLLGP